MNFVTRARWGAKAPTSRIPWVWDDVLGIAVHWPGGNTPNDHSQCDDVVRSEQANQMNTRGYRDIAYNALICKHGYVYEGRWFNDESGANGTTAGNQTYFAVSFLVGLTEEPPQVMYDAFKEVRALVLAKQPHATAIQPHSHFVQDQCPGDRLRAAIAAGKLQEDVLTDAQMAELKKYIRDVAVEQMTAIMWGANPVEPAGVLHLPDTGSWNTAVVSNNVKAVLAAIAKIVPSSGGTVDIAALAKAVADELHNRLAG